MRDEAACPSSGQLEAGHDRSPWSAARETHISENPIIIYATDWCSDCIRSRNFLLKHAVAFTWINIDNDPDGARYVVEVNKGMRSVPTIVFEDGSILVEPTNVELGDKLGISNA